MKKIVYRIGKKGKVRIHIIKHKVDSRKFSALRKIIEDVLRKKGEVFQAGVKIIRIKNLSSINAR